MEITKEEYENARITVRLYKKQEYENLPYIEGKVTMGTSRTWLQARKDKKTGDVTALVQRDFGNPELDISKPMTEETMKKHGVIFEEFKQKY